MKELWLAMDANLQVFGFDVMPILREGLWCRDKGNCYHSNDLLRDLGIDVTKFNITHEKPIKIRAVWEVCND